jgi:hypothetical protein
MTKHPSTIEFLIMGACLMAFAFVWGSIMPG